MIFPGARAPLFSPSRIIHSAGLSLTEPPGLYHSALPRMVTPGTSREMLSNSKSGVFPTSSTGRDPNLSLILVIMSELLYKLGARRPEEVNRKNTDQRISRRADISPPAMVGAQSSLYLFTLTFRYVESALSAQKFQNSFDRPSAAGEDGGIELGIGACLALSELHHEVLELLGSFGFEGEDELVVVDAEAVAGVVLHGVMLAAYLHVLVHHALALFEGEPIPCAALNERVDEEVVSFAGHDVGASREAWGVFADVDGAS